MKMRFLIGTCLLALTAAGGAAAQDLFNQEGYRALVADPRAYRAGDNLTVVITEAASASTTAKTTTNKEGSVAGVLRTTTDNGQGSIDVNEEFQGGGRIERTGRLLAQITVVVQSVDANGDLHIRGEQEIDVNNEKQRIYVEGRVRPQDIRSDNSVLSSRIGQARIEYKGKGVLAEKQRPGLLTRLLSWFWIL